MIAPRKRREIAIFLAAAVIATVATPAFANAYTQLPAPSLKSAPGDTWHPQPDLPEISFSISGVTLDAPVVQGAYQTFTGHLQPGGTLRVSGTARFHPVGTLTYPLLLSADVNVDGKTDKFSWGRTDVKGPGDFSQSFDVSVPIPTHPVSGGFAISINYGDWVFEGDGVSGSFTGPIPLCDEAASFFGMDAKKLAETPSNMLVSYDQLNQGFKDAVAAYKQAHGGKDITFSPGTSAYTAGRWLFGYGGGSAGDVDAVRKEFSFTNSTNKDSLDVAAAQKDGSLYTGVYRPPAGSEAGLVQDMVRASNNATHKLTPGEVFGLALGETGGDARKAFLLAHNALRGLGRGAEGDRAAFGIGTDLKFVEKYLQPLTSGGDNAGVWYHTFGTAFYHLQTYGKDASGGTAGVAEVVSAEAYALILGIRLTTLNPKWGARVVSALDSVRGFNQGAGLSKINADLGETPFDRAAYTSEQAYREAPFGGNQASDPTKFCFNIDGIRIATEMHNGFPEYRPVPTLTGSTGEGAAPALSDGSVHFGGSPVDFIWERDGSTLTLNHKTGALTGDLSLAVVPFYEQSSQTYGVIWIDSPASPVKVTFKATDAGTLHLESVDPANQLTAYIVPVATGDSLTYATPAGAKQPALTRAGKTIEPVQASLNSDSMVRVLLFVAVMGLAVAVVALAWWRRGRSTGPASEAAQGAN